MGSPTRKISIRTSLVSARETAETAKEQVKDLTYACQSYEHKLAELEDVVVRMWGAHEQLWSAMEQMDVTLAAVRHVLNEHGIPEAEVFASREQMLARKEQLLQRRNADVEPPLPPLPVLTPSAPLPAAAVTTPNIPQGAFIFGG